MTVFFVQIGLELEHELYNGKLSDVKSAMLPVFGAVGGMTIPACIFLLFNYDTAIRAGLGGSNVFLSVYVSTVDRPTLACNVCVCAVVGF